MFLGYGSAANTFTSRLNCLSPQASWRENERREQQHEQSGHHTLPHVVARAVSHEPLRRYAQKRPHELMTRL